MNGESSTPRRTERARLADVAARAGVSVATASRSLGDGGKVSPGTRKRVLDAARELSYETSRRQSASGSRSRGAVAIIVPFVTRWFFAISASVAFMMSSNGRSAHAPWMRLA